MPDTRFRLFTADSLKKLAARYCSDRADTPSCYRPDTPDAPNLFFHERIGVASRGMGIWLKQYLVKKGRMLVNVDCTMLREIIDGILAAFMAGNPAYRPELFRDTVLVWRLYGLLKTFSAPTITAYMGNDTQGSPEQDVRRYQLARKLAQMYYDYMALVPELLHPEEIGKGELPENDPRRWQLDLWRLLCKDANGNPLISPAQAILQFLTAESLAPDAYSPVTFFGISAMPAYYLRILKKLATVQNVSFFYLNHCDDLWDGVKSEWEKLHDTGQFDILDNELDEQYSNTLLGNFGQQGREFFKAIMDLDNDVEDHAWDIDSADDDDDNNENDSLTLLQDIQQRIKGNIDQADSRHARLDAERDDSLVVHSCFSDQREVEVLHDCLLRLLTEYASGTDKSRLPLNDILVMAPDISRFAPIIRSVFDNGPLKNAYAICDRSLRETNQTADAFMAIMQLDNCQFALTRMNSLLDCGTLRNRFGLQETDVKTVKDWLNKAGIRWGKDADSRGEDCRYEEYSWQYGLDRLLLKLAVDGKNNEGKDKMGFAGLVPADIATGQEQMRLLGSLNRLYHELCAFLDDMKANGKTADDWCALLLEKRAVFFLPDGDSAREYAALGAAINDLRQQLTTAGEAGTIMPYGVILAAIASQLDVSASQDAFLNGKITFCSLLPMRGIPCKVIALLGMDSGEFPRPNDETSFSLINRNNASLLRYYDRSRSVEDRFTFLEALMSAEDYLMFFFRGQDNMTLSKLNAAAPVVELLAYARKLNAELGIKIPDKQGKPSLWPLTEHRLNSFDKDSFGPPLSQPPTDEGKKHKQHTGALFQNFSYNGDMAAIASLNAAQGLPARPRWKDILDNPPDALPVISGQHITVNFVDLLNFLCDPVDAFAVNCMKLHKQPWEEDQPGDYEPFKLNALESSRMKRALAQSRAAQRHNADVASLLTDFQDIKAMTQAQCRLPLGRMGDTEMLKCTLDSWIVDADFKKRYASQEQAPQLEHDLDLDVDVPTADWTAALWNRRKDEDAECADSTRKTANVTLKAKFKSVPENTGEGQGGYCSCTFAKDFTNRTIIDGYLKHLILCAEKGKEADITSLFYLNDKGKEKVLALNLQQQIQHEDTENDNEDASDDCSQTTQASFDAKAQLAFILKLYLAGKRWLLPLFGNVSVAVAKGKEPKNDFQKDLARLNTALVFNTWASWKDTEELAETPSEDGTEKLAETPSEDETEELTEVLPEDETEELAERDDCGESDVQASLTPSHCIRLLASKCYAGLKQLHEKGKEIRPNTQTGEEEGK